MVEPWQSETRKVLRPEALRLLWQWRSCFNESRKRSECLLRSRVADVEQIVLIRLSLHLDTVAQDRAPRVLKTSEWRPKETEREWGFVRRHQAKLKEEKTAKFRRPKVAQISSTLERTDTDIQPTWRQLPLVEQKGPVSECEHLLLGYGHQSFRGCHPFDFQCQIDP